MNTSSGGGQVGLSNTFTGAISGHRAAAVTTKQSRCRYGVDARTTRPSPARSHGNSGAINVSRDGAAARDHHAGDIGAGVVVPIGKGRSRYRLRCGGGLRSHGHITALLEVTITRNGSTEVGPPLVLSLLPLSLVSMFLYQPFRVLPSYLGRFSYRQIRHLFS